MAQYGGPGGATRKFGVAHLNQCPLRAFAGVGHASVHQPIVVQHRAARLQGWRGAGLVSTQSGVWRTQGGGSTPRESAINRAAIAATHGRPDLSECALWLSGALQLSVPCDWACPDAPTVLLTSPAPWTCASAHELDPPTYRIIKMASNFAPLGTEETRWTN